MQDLFENQKALSLVEGIAKVGYLTHERPVVVKRGDEFYVVEGNRRVAALKAIQNPNLVPSFRTRIEKIVDDLPSREVLRKVEVLVAPSQGAANQLVAALHTSNPRVPWSRPRQAAFFQAQLHAGRTLEELRETYPTIDVRQFVQRSSVLDLFRDVEYQDSELKGLVESGTRIISTLERLYSNRDFQDIIGLRFDPETGQAAMVGDPSIFSALAEKIVKDYKHRRVNTRILGTQRDPRYIAYLDSLKAKKSELLGSASLSGASGGERGAESDSSENHPMDDFSGSVDTGNEAEKPRRRSGSRLRVEGLKPIANYLQLEEIFNELSSINYKTYPNATYDLMRSFLEKTIKAYADSLGSSVPPKSSGKFVFMSDCFNWLEKQVKADHQTSLLQAIKIVRGSEHFVDFASSAEHMNAHNHNFNISATSSQVEQAWKNMYPLLRYMMK